MRLLVVEDAVKMGGLLRRGLQENGHAVDLVRTGADAVWLGTERDYDVIVLDLMLGDIDGFQVCRRLRDEQRWAPVLMLTARDAVDDRVRGLDAGADDYLTKPFAFAGLLARVRALSRRGHRERPAVLRVGNLSLDPATREVRRGQEPVSLTAREFSLLDCFMRRPGEVLGRAWLLEQVWGFAFDGDPHVVTVYVGYLREKIDAPFGRSTLRTGGARATSCGTTVRRPPTKLRITLAFGTVTAVLFAGIGVGLYFSVAAALLDEIDTGLAFRAATLQAQAEAPLEAPGADDPQLAEPGEALAQVLSVGGTVLQASPSSRRESVLPVDVLGRLDGPLRLERRVPGIANVTRLLAVPVQAQGRRMVVVVGASMQDRADTLRLVAGFVAAAEPLALLVACLAGWRLAGVALDPVERMRRQAAAVAVSGLDRRLSVPATDDEIARLARTLNEMLDRLERSFRTERQFLDTASHELRTPLAALRAELDLALARPRSLAETQAALLSASEETDRLSRLAEELLVLSRVRQGRLPLRRSEVSLRELVAGTVRRWRPAAAAAGVRIVVDAAGTPVHLDPMRMGQALDNLLDNAVRHCAADGVVSVTAQVDDGAVRITVADDGPGFPEAARSWSEPDPSAGAGLGVGIVRAVAEAHGGGLQLNNRPGGGACAVLSLPAGAGA